MAFTKITAAGIDTSGTITTQSISVSGVSTVGSLSIGATGIISSARQLQNIASLDATTTATIESAVANAPNTFTDLSVTGISTLGVTSATNLTAQSLNVSGIITATQLSTGASGTGVNISTDTISGPATLTIDPAAVGDNTGAVRIKGDLYVDGTQFIVNSTTIELADFNVGIASTVGTNALLDGAGIGIGSTGIRKTLTWNNSSTALKSSEDFDISSGKVYRINGTSVLSNNTLGSGVVTSSLTSVGTLGQLQVTGVSTFSNGPVLIGSATSTGTASQPLQVTGGAYVSGSVGIGTVTPRAKLDIGGGPAYNAGTYQAPLVSVSGGYLSIKSQTADGVARLTLIGDSDTGDGTIDWGGNGNFNLKFTNNGNERARFDGSGNIGVGVTNPSYKLDVNGSIKTQATGSGTGILLHTNTGWSVSSNLAQFWTGQINGFAFYSNSLGDGTNERMRIDGVGAIIKNQATREYNYSGFAANNAAITIDVPVVDDTNNGCGHKIWANHTHYTWSGYGALLECWVSSRGTTIAEQYNTHNVTSGNGGAWTVTKPNATTLRISKSAGAYSGAGYYWVRVVTNY